MYMIYADKIYEAEYVEIDGVLYVWLPEINVKLAIESPALALAA